MATKSDRATGFSKAVADQVIVTVGGTNVVISPVGKGGSALSKRGPVSSDIPARIPMPGILAAKIFARGKSGKTPSKREISDAAKMVRAHKELIRVAELRLVHQAMKTKTSQQRIAALLGTSQPTISRMAQQIERTPSILEPSPREVIYQRAAGQIDTETMMSALRSYVYDSGQHDPTGGDGFVRGDWRQIEDALTSGLITDEEYERVAREAPTAKPPRAAR